MDNFLEKVIRIVFRILHMEVKERTVGSLVQFIKFGIVGLSNSAVGYALNIATLLQGKLGLLCRKYGWIYLKRALVLLLE